MWTELLSSMITSDTWILESWSLTFLLPCASHVHLSSLSRAQILQVLNQRQRDTTVAPVEICSVSGSWMLMPREWLHCLSSSKNVSQRTFAFHSRRLEFCGARFSFTPGLTNFICVPNLDICLCFCGLCTTNIYYTFKLGGRNSENNILCHVKITWNSHFRVHE